MHTLKLLGELDRTTAVRLEAAIERLCELEVAGITLDLRELSSIDTTGVAVIAFRCGWCRRNGRGFAIVHGPATVQRVFEQAGELARLPFVAHAPEQPAERPLAAKPTTKPPAPATARAHGDLPQRRKRAGCAPSANLRPDRPAGDTHGREAREAPARRG